MQMFRVEHKQNTVLASEELTAGLYQDPVGVESNMKAHAKKLKVFFERYATAGRSKLTKEAFHEADRELGIWEFRSGQLRAFCFFDNGSLIVVSHVSLKKTQRADTRDVEKAARLKHRYILAKRLETLKIEERKNDHE